MDYVEASVNKMFEQYLKRWNNHKYPDAVTQQINTAGNTQFGGQNFLIEAESEKAGVNYDPAQGKNKIQFNFPIRAKSFKTNPDGNN